VVCKFPHNGWSSRWFGWVALVAIFFLVAQLSQLASWIHRHDIEVTNIGENQPSPKSHQSVNGSTLLHTDPLWSNSLGLFWAITIIPWATQWCCRGAGLHEASGSIHLSRHFLGPLSCSSATEAKYINIRQHIPSQAVSCRICYDLEKDREMEERKRLLFCETTVLWAKVWDYEITIILLYELLLSCDLQFYFYSMYRLRNYELLWDNLKDNHCTCCLLNCL
jgi:hypothetical protein